MTDHKLSDEEVCNWLAACIDDETSRLATCRGLIATTSIEHSALRDMLRSAELRYSRSLSMLQQLLAERRERKSTGAS